LDEEIPRFQPIPGALLRPFIEALNSGLVKAKVTRCGSRELE